MNDLNVSPAEQQRLDEAHTPPSMLDEKKYLEERRRRLEASLHGHVEELRDRGRQAGQVALVGAGALVGIWLVAKAVGKLTGGRKRRKARALKEPVRLNQLAPGSPTGTTAPPLLRPDMPAGSPERSYTDQEGAARRHRPTPAPAPAPPAEPAGPSFFQTFMGSEAGRMMSNQLVALLMVFVTRKLESVLQIDRSADIGSVKESDLTPYRIVDPVSDATVVVDDTAEPARPHVFYPPPIA